MATEFPSIQAVVDRMTMLKKTHTNEMLLTLATVEAAEHLYNCRCMACLVYFATCGMTIEDENDEEFDAINDAGPFTLEEINAVRTVLDRKTIARLPVA
jgi:hypothetical protein